MSYSLPVGCPTPSNYGNGRIVKNALNAKREGKKTQLWIPTCVDGWKDLMKYEVLTEIPPTQDVTYGYNVPEGKIYKWEMSDGIEELQRLMELTSGEGNGSVEIHPEDGRKLIESGLLLM